MITIFGRQITEQEEIDTWVRQALSTRELVSDSENFSEDWAYELGKIYCSIIGRPNEYASYDSVGASLIYQLGKLNLLNKEAGN